MIEAPDSPIRAMISLSRIIEVLDVDRSTIYRWMDDEKFPRPVNVGDNMIRFYVDEVQEWQKQREQQSAAPLPKDKIKPVRQRPAFRPRKQSGSEPARGDQRSPASVRKRASDRNDP